MKTIQQEILLLDFFYKTFLQNIQWEHFVKITEKTNCNNVTWEDCVKWVNFEENWVKMSENWGKMRKIEENWVNFE